MKLPGTPRDSKKGRIGTLESPGDSKRDLRDFKKRRMGSELLQYMCSGLLVGARTDNASNKESLEESPLKRVP